MAYPVFPTLSRRPALKTKETTIDPTLRDTFDNGMESTRAKFTRPRQEWTITYQYLNAADKALVDNFMVSTVNYGAGIFTFSDNRIPTAIKIYTVRFSKLPAYEDADWVEDAFRQNLTFSLREV